MISDTPTPPPRRAHFAVLALLCVAFVIYGSWVPFQTIPLSFEQALQVVRAQRLFAFGPIDRSDWATNALLFVPIGFCWLAACRVDRPRRAANLLWIPAIVAGCFVLSCVIEVGQIWLPQRVFSQADIAAQVMGTVLGITLWFVVGDRVTTWLRSYANRKSTRRQMQWLLEAYLAGLVIYAVLPLNLTIHPEELYAKLDSHRVVLIPFSQTRWNWETIGELFTDVAIFIPVGGLAAIGWLPADRRLRPLGESLFLGGMIVVAVELCQLPVLSRFCDTTDVVTGFLGILIGALAMHRLTPHSTSDAAPTTGLQTWHWLFIAFAFTVVLITLAWLPFEPIEDRTLIRRRFQQLFRLPGDSLMSDTTFMALTFILRKLLAFLLLGAIYARAVHRRSASSRARWLAAGGCLVVAAGVAVLIEVGQVVNLAHTPDLSDAMICTIGAAIGIAVTVRLLPHERGSATAEP